MTTNEADRTDDRVPTSDVLAPEEAPSDESPPPDRKAERRGDVAPRGDEPNVAADTSRYRDRWSEIQTGFVDEPGHAVQSAGELLTELIDDLNRRLTTELDALDARRGASDDVSTEDLRVTFQRYRTFFDRLMAV